MMKIIMINMCELITRDIAGDLVFCIQNVNVYSEIKRNKEKERDASYNIVSIA